MTRIFPPVAILLVILLSASTSAQGESATAERSGSTATADEVPEAKTPEDATAKKKDESAWRFELTPYFWAPSLDTTAKVVNAEADVDVSFKDIWENADAWGVMARFEAWKDGEWGVILDGTYLDVEVNETAAVGPFSPRVKVTQRIGIIDLAGAYRIVDHPLNEKGSSRLALDGYGGLRYTHLKQEFDARGSGPVGQIDAGGTEGWFEVFVGARVMWQASRRWSFMARGDIGGFGIGSASDFTYRAVAGVGYNITERVIVRAGYQVYGLDFEGGTGTNRIGWDGIAYGPVLGLSFVF